MTEPEALREYASFSGTPIEMRAVLLSSADRIEKLVEENGVLFAANVRLNSRADIDSDGYVDRIEKLEAALRSIAANACCDSCREAALIARKALEGKDD